MIKTLAKAQQQERVKFRVPRSVQDAIPIRRIWSDGIFLCGNQYSKTWSFTDINYAIAGKDDKTAMFLDYSELLNALDSGASAKITLCNRRVNKAEFERSVLLPMKGDTLDEYRREFNEMLLAQTAGSNSIVRERYLTVSVVKRSIDEARAYFARVGTDLVTHFAALSSVAAELPVNDRLRIFRDFFKVGQEPAFEFNIAENAKRGQHFKDWLCPDSMEFAADHFKIDGRFGRVLYLQDFASYLKDSFVSELCDLDRDLMLSIDILPVPTDEAARQLQNTLLGVETNAANWQRRQNANNNFSAAIPYDMELQRKERFACDLRLQLRKTQVKQRGQGHDAEMRSLYNVSRNLDLDQAEGLSNFDRRLICVPEHCPKSCSARRSCRYRKYLEEANGRRVTIQICNHNFLLADATHRQEKWPRLLKNYQALVIDEAHKLPEAAAQMYGRRFSVQDGENLCRLLEKSHCTHTAQQLRERLTALQAAFCADEIVNAAVAFCPSNVQNAALLSAQAAFRQAAVTRTAKPLPAWPLHRLRESADVLQLFIEQNSNCILYIQYDSDGKPTLCADCRDLPARLDKALWSVRQAAILTSGTLSAGGNFTHTVQRIGLNNPQTFRAESPFDYKRNCILYFPKRTSTPLDEVEWLSQEIEQLVQVCHGHALVLFTSYDQVGRVQQRLQGLLAYPLLTARRNGQLFVQAFKQLPNAVLFAAGPCWEGVDFPGDRVSLLIIARLPFPVPDPVSDAEKAKYPDLHSYIQAEVIPTMQKKLRQGFGRAIRTETDTCTVAILDPRAAPGGRYHRAALDALPKMNMTQDIKDVEHFIRAVKGAEYFFA